ncbi:MAG: sigma-70 family RNA polymerase sigma factor [Acidimicrobiia bacterium]
MGVANERMVTADEIYSEHAVELVRFATVLVGQDDANDIVSSAVLRVLDHGLDHIDHPRAYLFRAVSNEARNFRRGAARRRLREERSPVETVTFTPDPYPEVVAAVRRLSVRQKAVVYLAYWEDMTEGEIADHLGISQGSVRRHLARARNHLRRTLNEN